jgi:hypothetical protein
MPDHNSINNITNHRGYLLRERPGSNVPVGPTAAVQLSDGLTDREICALMFVEQLGMATPEQLARVFFKTTRSAYETLMPVVRRRFLANIGADLAQIRRALGHRPPPRSPAYILDWNGAYLLPAQHDYQLRNWRPSTVALITSRFGHNLGVSEVWSYLLAAARATHERNPECDSDGSLQYRLSIGLRNERASLLTERGAREASRLLASANVDNSVAPFGQMLDYEEKVRDRVLLQPDATFILAISELNDPATHFIPPILRQETLLTGVRHMTAHTTRSGPNDSLPGVSSSFALESWESAILSDSPYGVAMVASEKLVAKNHSETYHRALLLEMETGANNSKDVVNKINAYNRLIRTNERAWVGTFGVGPRVLVVTRTEAQLDTLAKIWRTHYFFRGKETSVIMTSLQTLAAAYTAGGMNGQAGSRGRRALLEQSCWIDVMAPGAPAWMTLGEALRIGVVMRSK